jgi:hypothetical protein
MGLVVAIIDSLDDGYAVRLLCELQRTSMTQSAVAAAAASHHATAHVTITATRRA